MGQSYIVFIENENKKAIYAPYDFQAYSKLTEHGYLGNEFTAVIMNEIFEKPSRVWWLGQYTKTEDFKNKKISVTDMNKTKNGKYALLATQIDKCNQNWNWKKPSYILNHSKKQYLEIHPWFEKEGWQYNPLTMITATGNGRGGGDYYGENEEFIGDWAGDVIEIITQTEQLENYHDYADMGLQYVFPCKE